MKRRILRDDILKSGLDLMFINGYNATGIKEITQNINIPKGSFYNHFSSKEEFGLEIVHQYCKNGAKFYSKELLEGSGSPLRRLEKFYDKMIKNYKDVLKCKLGCIMSNFSTEMADINESFREVLDIGFDECEKIIVQCLIQAQERKEIPNHLNVKTVGAFMLNSWHGAFVRMKSTGTIKPLKDYKKLIFNNVLK